MAASKSPGPRAPSGIDLAGENVHWDFRDAMSYADYLKLKTLLDCQRPLSGQHDEMLFITIHQASELWIKLCLHEITAAISQIRKGELGPAFKMMSRIARVQMQLRRLYEARRPRTSFFLGPKLAVNKIT